MSVVDTSQEHSQGEDGVEHVIPNDQTLFEFTQKGIGNVFMKRKLSLLAKQDREYQANLVKIDARHTDLNSITKIRQRFMNDKIKCVKYNYSLDQEIQSLAAFDGYL